MKQDTLNKITQTVEGYEVKNVAWIGRDCIIRGQVKCPIMGRETLHNGFVVITWRKNGKILPKWGDRKDLNIIIPQ